MTTAAPLVTLTTDFGTRDGYVAQMKGVLLSEGAANLRVVDLSHALPAQDLLAAALFAEAAFPRFPPGTIHVLVVDPGVGSARRAVVAEVAGQLVVGPDNGVFSLLYDGQERVVEIDTARLGGFISSTFHGRDVFARVAAALSRGEAHTDFGTGVLDPVRLEQPVPRIDGATIHGEVIHVDRFGNLITNLTARGLAQWAGGAPVRVSVGERALGSPRTHYAEVAPGEPLALTDSSGRLEVAVRNGSAAQLLTARVGDPVSVTTML